MRRHGLTATILSAICALTICACGSAPGATPANGTTEAASQAEAARSVTDALGRTVSMPDSITRIVALDPADAEIVCALGAGDLLAGRSAYCDYPPEISDVPVVASGAETNVEEILGLGPDLVVMSSMAEDSAVVDQLSASSVPTLVFEATTIDAIYENINAIGQALGREDGAQGLVDEMKGKFDHARELAAGRESAEAPVIYFEVSPLEYGLWTAGSGTFMQEAADLLGATNAFADLNGWASVSEEQVIERAPTCIVTTSTDEHAADEILSRTSWQHIPAVANKRVLAVPDDMFTRPGPRVADATVMLAEYLGEDA